MTVEALRNIYQIKATLVGIKPPIWRRLLVSSTMVLDEFHEALQIVMGWTNSHLHQFIANGEYFGMPDPEFEFDCKDESKVKLNKLFCAEHDAILYEYDFGDGWEHKIVLEKIHPFEKDVPLPVCKKGKRSCPPEDCGGIWGYQDFLDIIQDSSHAEYEETMEWIGGEFDPESFDIEKVNSILAEYCR